MGKEIVKIFVSSKRKLTLVSNKVDVRPLDSIVNRETKITSAA